MALWLRIADGEPFELTQRQYVIGREPGCDIVLHDRRASRRHAALTVLPDQTAEIRDLGSRNGTLVDGERIEGLTRLTQSHEIEIGRTSLALAPHPHELPEPPAKPDSLVVRLQQSANRTRLLAGGALAAALLLGGAAAVLAITDGDPGRPERPPANDRRALIQRLQQATVLIEALDEKGEVQSIGSGSIVSPDGFILTNAHVGNPAAPGQGIAQGNTAGEDPASLRIRRYAGDDQPAAPAFTAEVAAADGYLDLAVLKVTAAANGDALDPETLELPAVPIGDSDRMANGDDLIVVGFPGIGGGFEGSIDVIDGLVAGFERDERVPKPRGWMKSNADISYGNSGGLGASAEGRIVGVPTEIRPDTKGAGTVKAKLRPINLAKPVLEAARTGRPYKSPYFVHGTGQERFEHLGWAQAAPGTGCAFTKVDRYPAGVKALTPVWKVSGMTEGEDLRWRWAYLEDKLDEEPEIALDKADKWRTGTGNECLPDSVSSGDAPFKDGIWAAQVLAGPNLKVVGTAVVEVGGTAPTATPTPTATPGPQTQPGADCRAWTPANHLTTGVDLPEARLPNGQVVAEPGRFGLTRPVGEAAGYATVQEADQAIFGAIDRNIFGVADLRWTVIAHQGRWYGFEVRRYRPQFLGTGGGEDSVVVNPDPPPCRILPEEGRVAVWYAVRFVGDVGNAQWIRYDWYEGREPKGRFTTLPP